MIWGLTLEPGKVYTEIVQDEVQLSMASLECRRDMSDNEGNFSHIVMTTNNAEYLLCTLVKGATYQQNLDLKIMPQEKVAFSVQGASTVYLMGYSTVYPGIDQELDSGEDQSIPGWQEYSVDEHQEDNIISVDDTFSPPRNAAPEQYAELTSSNTSSREGELPSSKIPLQESQLTSPKPSSREGGLVSSEDLLVEDWTVEPQEEDESDYIVESVKAEQVEDVEAVFPVADIDVKEEPSSPVASLSNPSSSETLMGTPGSLSNLELQSYQPGEESSHAVSSSWLVQIPEDTNSSSRLSIDEQEFTSDVENDVSEDGILKIIEQPTHQRMTDVEKDQINLQPIASPGHYSLTSPDFSGNQGTKSIVSWSPSLSTSTTDAYHYQILPNAKQQNLHLSRGRHSAVQKNSRKGRPSQSLGRYQLAPARGRVKSRGLSSRGLSHKYHQLNARGGSSHGMEANQLLPGGLTGSFKMAGSPSLSNMGSSSTVPYHADGTNLYSNQSPRAASHSRVGTTQSKHHVCEICQKSFVTMSLLKRHQVIHTGLKPHKCPMCPSSFARNDNLLRHLKNNHKEAYMYFRGGLKNS